MELIQDIILSCADEAVVFVEEMWASPDPSLDGDCSYPPDPNEMPPMTEEDWDKLRMDAKEDEKKYCECFDSVSLPPQPNFIVESCIWKLKLDDNVKRLFSSFWLKHIVDDPVEYQPMLLRRRRGFDYHDTNTYFLLGDGLRELVLIYLPSSVEKYYFTFSSKVDTTSCSIKIGQGHSIERCFSWPVFIRNHLFHDISIDLEEWNMDNIPTVSFSNLTSWFEQ